MKAQRKAEEENVYRLLKKSRIETDTLKQRDLRCPECNFKIQTVFSDAKGHLGVKCPKCKGTYVLNLAYFRTMSGHNYIRK